MTSLRITCCGKVTHRFLLARCGFLLLAAGVLGCGKPSPPADDSIPPISASPGTNDPDWLTARDLLPSPDADRIEYDAQKRTLTFQDLPRRDRWMVRLPDEAIGRPVGPIHTLPEGVDLSRTLVYYVRTGSKHSAPVTVAQIEAGRGTHVSLATFP